MARMTGVTGRLLQQQPKTQELPGSLADRLDKLHEKGMTLLEVDFAHIEVRVFALMSQQLEETKMSKVTIDEDDGEFVIHMPYDEDAKEALKEKFAARWDPGEKAWCVSSDDFTIQEVEAELKLHFPRAF